MILALAAPDPGRSVPDHLLSPTAVAALVVIAFLLDFFSIGPAALHVRLLFICVVTAARQGFDDSPLDKWTVDKAAGLIQAALDKADGAYIAGASATAIVGFLIGALFVYAVGCMLPIKWSKKMGRLSTLQWKEAPLRKLNFPVWVVAFACGIMSDLPEGFVGVLADAVVNLSLFIAGPLPAIIFGAA